MNADEGLLTAVERGDDDDDEKAPLEPGPEFMDDLGDEALSALDPSGGTEEDEEAPDDDEEADEDPLGELDDELDDEVADLEDGPSDEEIAASEQEEASQASTST